VQFVLGINAAIATILLALLLRRQHGLRADRWLVLALVVLIFSSLGLALNGRADLPSPILMPFAIFVGGSSFFISPIALFLYVRDVTGRFKSSDLIWFAPPAIHLVWMLWEAFFGSGVVFVLGFAGIETGITLLSRFLSPLSVLFTLLFPGVALIELAHYRANIKQHLSGMDGVDLSWVRAVLWSVIAGGLLGTLLMGLAANHLLIGLEQASALIMLIIGLQLGASGYFALYQVEALQDGDTGPVNSERSVDLDICIADYASLRQAMQSDHFYRQEDFRLRQLADTLGWPQYRITEALQYAGNINFFDFVNGFRVEEAGKLLTDPGNARVSVLALAFDAGFQSKASFNRIFKAQTGETPSGYRARHLVKEGADLDA
jgi:AraC-like DNA-binding protein